MPEGPAPTPVLSKTTTTRPGPSTRASSSFARCHAVESPWTPAPMTTNRELAGTERIPLFLSGYRQQRQSYFAVVPIMSPGSTEPGTAGASTALGRVRDGDRLRTVGSVWGACAGRLLVARARRVRSRLRKLGDVFQEPDRVAVARSLHDVLHRPLFYDTSFGKNDHALGN